MSGKRNFFDGNLHCKKVYLIQDYRSTQNFSVRFFKTVYIPGEQRNVYIQGRAQEKKILTLGFRRYCSGGPERCKQNSARAFWL